VYSLYITSRTEDVSRVLRDELAVVVLANTYPVNGYIDVFGPFI
jgi:hypothetical protein